MTTVDDSRAFSRDAIRVGIGALLSGDVRFRAPDIFSVNGGNGRKAVIGRMSKRENGGSSASAPAEARAAALGRRPKLLDYQ